MRMNNPVSQKPWERLEAIISQNDIKQLEAHFHRLSNADKILALSRLDDELRQKILTLLPHEQAADLMEAMPDEQAVEMIDALPVSEAAAIIDEMDSDKQVDLLTKLENNEAEAILNNMDPKEAQDARQRLEYPEDTAGGMMITEYLAFNQRLRVSDLLKNLYDHGDQYSEYDIQYFYIINDDNHLIGLVQMRDLLLSRKDTELSKLLTKNLKTVSVNDNQEKLQTTLDNCSFIALPVLDKSQRLIGILRREAVLEASSAVDSNTFRSFSGIIGGEEFRTMPLYARSRRRLSWLWVNILLNLVSISVIALFQDTIKEVVFLAVLLPMVSDMSGCSGNQAIAVSIRELALGQLKPNEFIRVFLKESSVGLINGIVLGITIAAVAILYSGNPYLGLIVGAALSINTLFSVCLGGLLPLFLRRIKIDPAVAASPLLTTMTDMLGFFFLLYFATQFLDKLTT